MDLIKYIKLKNPSHSKAFIEHQYTSYKGFYKFVVKTDSKERTCYNFDGYNFHFQSYCDILFDYFRKHIVPKKNYSKSASRITKQIRGRIKNGYQFSLTTDINKFYETIDHNILLEKIVRLNQPLLNRHIKSFIYGFRVFNNSCTSGLPTGINLTQILAEFYLIDFEKSMKAFCLENNFFYYRYVDDILILSEHNTNNSNKYSKLFLPQFFSTAAKTKRKISSKLSDIKLALNNSKTIVDIENSQDVKVFTKDFTYLGYHHMPKSVSLSDRTIRLIKGHITSKIINSLFYKLTKNKTSFSPKENLCYTIFEINRAIKGTSIKKIEYNDNLQNLIMCGMAPMLHITDNHHQINELEKWFGKITQYAINLYHKKYPQDINEEFMDDLKRIKIESLKYWTYKFKKNYLKASLLSLNAEFLYSSQKRLFDFLFQNQTYKHKKIISEDMNNTVVDFLNTKQKKNWTNFNKYLKNITLKEKEYFTKLKEDDVEEDYSLSYEDVCGDPDLLDALYG